MVQKKSSIPVIVKDTYEQMSKEALRIFKEHFAKSGVIGFATGDSPKLLYSLIASECRSGKMSFKEKISFNLDEYYPIKPLDPESFRYYMDLNLFNIIDLPKQNIKFPDCELNDYSAVMDYKGLYKRYGPVDLQILGIGTSGHIGFNEPGSDLNSEIRIVDLTRETVKRNEAPHSKALTMGIKEIMESRFIMLIASGTDKSRAVQMAIEGPVTPEVPASFLQLHKNVVFILDDGAARRLSL
ncbi:MAG: glucosamine-6-phosphate deaminase [Candidatus Micrarchaeota archaeon]|nr:glucosamine-6-phosphate deaminase [Candidatus Micrarchaeota archaeon]MDE1834648.1 glucosamine-6-phosphate deaminase [Candidatus Micrarchaeota archaeon]MDE1859643.1 glucosamine-6-phosphate deaminase [Candidatus Micrarchaeota archaeon]